MTSSTRSRPPGTSTPRPRRASDPEERFTRWVTIGFVALIVAVVAIVVVAFLADYWVQHLKPVASVGGATITRDQWADRARLEYFRLEQQDRDLSEAISAGEVTADEAATRRQAITSAKDNVASSSIESLIDLTLKGQLAAADGLSVTDADVDQAIADEATSPEARQISIIVVEPQVEDFFPTPQEQQAAFSAAQQAAADLAAGKDFAEVARERSTDDSAADGGAYGFVTRDSELDPAFLATLFAVESGQVTPVIKGEDGSWRIGRVDAIRPGTMDSGLEQTIRDEVGWDLYRNQVRKEALAQKLEDHVVAGATDGDVDQAHLAEILLTGDPTLPAEEDDGEIRASHILYSPNDDPSAASEVPADDPEWAAAQALAETAARQLRAVTDADRRMEAFARRAERQSDDTGSGANGGSLGSFTRDRMVPEFADPLFDDPGLVRGDIVGPVKSAFGWHVILFEDRTPGLGERLDAVKARLAEPDADFAAIAKELSEGAEAPAGGDLGWRTAGQLDEAAALAVFAQQAGGTTEPVPLDDGYHIFRILDRATRPLDLQQRAAIAATAFDDWFDPKRSAAEEDQTITRDGDIFSNQPQVGV